MTTTVGVAALGTEPLAGSGPSPSVTVTPLGTVSTGGPDLTVEWTFTPAGTGDAQAMYRVRILNDALTTEHYDSGWLSGTDVSHDVDVDAEGIPHDSSDVTVQVMVVDAGGLMAFDNDAFVMDWGTPHCTITGPADGAVWSDLDGVDVTWTFSDDDGANTQGWYRVRLLLPVAGLTVHDSGWVAGSDLSYRIDHPLGVTLAYRVEVQLKNNHGIRSD